MAGDDAEFDRILGRVAGPLAVEITNLDAHARERWEAYAAQHGWSALDWLDMPGALAWRREPPGVWEMTWQQMADSSESFDLRLMPPEHPLMWRRQLVELVRDLGETLHRDVELVDEISATPLLRFDAGLGVVRRASAPRMRALERPDFTVCCTAMAAQFEAQCETCVDPHDCPHQLIVFAPRSGEFGLPIRDGGATAAVIAFCPWCGSRVSGEANAASAD
jgi:hypothetical protein